MQLCGSCDYPVCDKAGSTVYILFLVAANYSLKKINSQKMFNVSLNVLLNAWLKVYWNLSTCFCCKNATIMPNAFYSVILLVMLA